jgi:signal transduction histidine kinase/CheY-like chemotaxis protein
MLGDRAIAGNAAWLSGAGPRDGRSLIHNHLLDHEDPAHHRGDESFVEISSGPQPAGWRVLVYRDPSEAFAVVRWFAWTVLGAGVLGLLLAAGVAYVLARGFSRRIDRLAEGTRRLAAGEYSHRVSDASRDELGELAGAFDHMADALNVARENLVESHAELERSNLQLLEASRLKDQFLANTSHELRTPLNGIMGFLGLVKDGVCDTHEEELDSVRQALECAHNLHGLIEDLLEVSRIEAGRLSLTRHAVQVTAALDRIVREMRPRAEAAGLAWHCEPIDPALAVRADERRLHQVLRHVVDNAIKFTQAGSVSISASELADTGHVRFEVRDTGVGVAPDRQQQVFERFVQGDGSATRRFGGTGLGLTLVRDLVEFMGGMVALESEGEGQGTTVSFTLPRATAAEEPDAEPRRAERGAAASAIVSLPSGPPDGSLVLVVEDDPATTSWLEALLHEAGLRTVAADSAERAWLLLRQLKPVLVLADHALPCAASARLRTGCDLARHMLAHATVRDIPVLVLSGLERGWIERQGPLPTNVTFRRKPAAREELLATVRRLLPDATSLDDDWRSAA